MLFANLHANVTDGASHLDDVSVGRRLYGVLSVDYERARRQLVPRHRFNVAAGLLDAEAHGFISYKSETGIQRPTKLSIRRVSSLQKTISRSRR
jgi:hypothetical protein